MTSQSATDQEFFDALRGEDELGAVIRAHIHIEARLQQVLEALTPVPEQLPKLRYEQRVKMAAALGLNENAVRPLKKLGEIRNQFGHRLDVTLTAGMVNDLFESLAEEDKAVIRAGYESTKHQLGLDWPEYDDTQPRHKFVTIAVALDKYLIVAENEARQIEHA